MRGRWWLIVLITIVSLGLGILIAGIPDKTRDRPLSVRVPADVTSTTSAATTSTISTTSTTTTKPPQPRAPGEVRVRVANASTASLAATHMTTRIAGLGYQTLPPVNSTRTDLPSTVVVFSPGFELEARALAQAVGATQVVSGDPTLTCDREACTGDVVVFVGRDLAT